MAKNLGYKNNYKFFINRAQSYKNLFDPSVGFFRPKNSDGKWAAGYNPVAYGANGAFPFTEGNGWQYLWYVPGDVPSFINIMRGDNAFTKKLDELRSNQPY